ncbi:MAG: hypothetical protein AAFV95_05010 [Bacteroidota bacterium]
MSILSLLAELEAEGGGVSGPETPPTTGNNIIIKDSKNILINSSLQAGGGDFVWGWGWEWGEG